MGCLRQSVRANGETTIAITNRVVIGAGIIASAPKLKLICIAATRTNCVDLEAAKNAGIPVRNVAGYSTPSVTQHTIGLLINLTTGMHRYAHEASQWAESPHFYPTGLSDDRSRGKNSGRGDLVNEADMADALKNETIAGVGLDVLTTEPPAKDHVLLGNDIPNLIITPHTAWASIESRQRLIEGIVNNIRGYLSGNVSNQVN